MASRERSQCGGESGGRELGCLRRGQLCAREISTQKSKRSAGGRRERRGVPTVQQVREQLCTQVLGHEANVGLHVVVQDEACREGGLVLPAPPWSPSADTGACIGRRHRGRCCCKLSSTEDAGREWISGTRGTRLGAGALGSLSRTTHTFAQQQPMPAKAKAQALRLQTPSRAPQQKRKIESRDAKAVFQNGPELRLKAPCWNCQQATFDATLAGRRDPPCSPAASRRLRLTNVTLWVGLGTSQRGPQTQALGNRDNKP